MPEPANPSLRFAETVRILCDSARRQGLEVPAFRSPCRNPEHTRTIRRRPDGGVTVAVRITGRPFAAVQADLIDSLVATNPLDKGAAVAVREQFWCALAAAGQAQ